MVIEPFNCSATQTLNVSCILRVVVGDSLKETLSVVVYSTSAIFNYFLCDMLYIIGY